jgi:putative peptidoglycan lipid II flippase
MLAFVCSRLLGLWRTSLLAATFGNGPAANAFQAAFAIPDFIFNLVVGGALNSAFIPVFAELLGARREEEAWDLTATVLNGVIALLAVLGGLAALFAPLLAPLLAPGFDPATQALVVQLTRILFLQPLLFGAGSVAFAILNARQHFLFPAWAPVVYNVFQILALLFLTPRLGINGLAIGVVVGALAYAGMQVPVLYRYGFSYRATLNWRAPAFRRVLRMLVPRTLTLASNQVGGTVTSRTIASTISGGVAALGYAYTLLLLPINVLGVSVATAAFPTLASMAGRGDRRALQATVRSALRGLLYLGFGSSALLVALRLPLIGLIYQHGAFGAADAALTASALLFYGLGVAPQLADELLPRAFFALQDARTPLVINLSVVAVNIALSVLLVRRLGLGGIALALTLAAFLEMLLLLACLQRKLPGLLDASFAGELGMLLIAACAGGLAAFLLDAPISHLPVRPLLQNVGGLLFGGLLGAAVFARVAAAFGWREHERLLGLLRRRR